MKARPRRHSRAVTIRPDSGASHDDDRGPRSPLSANAHDSLVAAAHRAQADALEIEATAKRRLADEIDTAKAAGELATDGRPKTVPDGNGFVATTTDIGLTRKQVHEARQIRDAEEAEPGIVRRVLDEKLAGGEEPIRLRFSCSMQACFKWNQTAWRDG